MRYSAISATQSNGPLIFIELRSYKKACICNIEIYLCYNNYMQIEPEIKKQPLISIKVRRLILGLFLLVCGLIGGIIYLQANPENVRLGQFDYSLEIVTSMEDHQQGLSGRPNLAPLHGMLFIFSTSGNYGLWMKDMNFALDIIWLDDNQRIVGLAENIRPESYPEIFYADSNSLFVIEINAGEAAQAGLKLGDQIQLSDVIPDQSES